MTQFYAFTLTGEASEGDLKAVLDFARQKGFEASGLRSQFIPERWDEAELAGVDVLGLVYPHDHESSKTSGWQKRRRNFQGFLGRFGIITAADLYAMTWQTFIGLAQADDGGHMALLLRTMHASRLRFSDFNPAQLFVTEVAKKDLLSVRAKNTLEREGEYYLEVLQVYTEAELRDFRNFGDRSLGEVKQRLAERGLHLRG